MTYTATLAMLHHPIGEAICLGVLVLSCWLGVLGMWRMETPTQALHYLALPAIFGGVALAVGAFLELGANQVFGKTVFIVLVMLGINVVISHASARAFRARELGHWEPRDGDPIEFVRDDRFRESNQ